jgi:hypothetical protein
MMQHLFQRFYRGFQASAGSTISQYTYVCLIEWMCYGYIANISPCSTHEDITDFKKTDCREVCEEACKVRCEAVAS